MNLKIIEFSKTILDLNKQKRYSDSLAYFKQNKSKFQKSEIAGNAYLISSILTALRHTGNIDSAHKFLDIYQIEISEKTEEIVLNAYSWLLYTQLKNNCQNLISDANDFEEEIFSNNPNQEECNSVMNSRSVNFAKIKFVIPLLAKLKSQFTYTALSNLFTLVLKSVKSKTSVDWKFISDFCDIIDPFVLSMDCQTINAVVKGVSKSIELASDREQWYAYKTNALFNLGRFEECYQLSSQALKTFSKFHYSNDVWFARRIALSKKSMGRSEEAISDLKILLKKKKDWFIQKELAEMLLTAGDLEQSFDFAIQSVNNFGELNFKADLIFLIGKILNLKKENELAYKHFSLAKLIREKEEWRIPSELCEVLELAGQKLINPEDYHSLKQELSTYWKTFKLKEDSSSQSYVGLVRQILHNNERGMDGFISYQKNESIYFKIKAGEPMIQKIKPGSKLIFNIYQPETGIKVMAVNLKIPVK